MLKKLEAAIQELEIQKESLLTEIQKYGWEDNRSFERIPEDVSITDLDDLVFTTTHTTIIPAQSPLPPGITLLYQRWYSAAQAILARNQASRLKEFDQIYIQIKEFIGRRYIQKYRQFELMDLINAQFAILVAVIPHIKFSIHDVELTAYSVLMDDEIDAARHLISKGFLRAAGVLAGVTLERHLKNLLRKHIPPIKYRKNATLSTLNDGCKDEVYDLVTWRKVQYLTDLRNSCAHDKTREPRKDDILDLIASVSAILRNHN